MKTIHKTATRLAALALALVMTVASFSVDAGATVTPGVYSITDPATGETIGDYTRMSSGRDWSDTVQNAFLFKASAECAQHLIETMRVRELEGLDPVVVPAGTELYNYLANGYTLDDLIASGAQSTTSTSNTTATRSTDVVTQAMIDAIPNLGTGPNVNADGKTYWYFPDVPDDHPYAKAINRAASLGLFAKAGIADGSNFEPDKSFGTGEAAKLAAQMTFGADNDWANVIPTYLYTDAATYDERIVGDGIPGVHIHLYNPADLHNSYSRQYFTGEYAAYLGALRFDGDYALPLMRCNVGVKDYENLFIYKAMTNGAMTYNNVSQLTDKLYGPYRDNALKLAVSAKYNHEGFTIATKGQFVQFMYDNGLFTDLAVKHTVNVLGGTVWNRSLHDDTTVAIANPETGVTTWHALDHILDASTTTHTMNTLEYLQNLGFTLDEIKDWGLAKYCPELRGDTPAAASTSQDTKVSDWAKDQVAKAQELGLVPDTLGNDYTANITRAQFAAVAVKLYEAMSGTKAPAASGNPFNDTSDSVIAQAYELGFVSGMSANTFAPDSLVTREQAASMLSRVYTKLGNELPAVTSTDFTDNGSISSWAMNSVAFMSSKGIVSGTGNGSFNPGGSATIEQALSISLRMHDNLG